MQSIGQRFRILFHDISDRWRRDATPLDFVWLARYRFLIIYSLIKFGLIVAVGLAGVQLHYLLPHSTRLSLLIFGVAISLAIITSALLLILGLGMANRFRLSRSTGVFLLIVTDFCLLLSVMIASMFENKLLLLLVLGMIACTTPLLVERISRYARRFTFKAIELVEARQENDVLLLTHTQELARAIEQERLSLERELHDGLLQELSALLLQLSMIMMRNSADGRLQLTADEAEKMRTALDRAIYEARNVIHDLNTPSTALKEIHSV
jgi:signal transduction histidine kinase